MVMRWLIQEWIAQLLGLRVRLRRGPEPDSWWLQIRERIVGFLVSRYADRPETEREGAQDAPAGPPDEERPSFCLVTPGDHPPRKCADMTRRLRSVSRINQAKRPRWRWF